MVYTDADGFDFIRLYFGRILLHSFFYDAPQMGAMLTDELEADMGISPVSLLGGSLSDPPSIGHRA